MSKKAQSIKSKRDRDLAKFTELDDVKKGLIEQGTAPVQNSQGSKNNNKSQEQDIKSDRSLNDEQKQEILNEAQKSKKKNKKKLKCDCGLISICVITGLSNSAYALIAPFLPIELVKVNVPIYLFGYIFSTYSLAVIICSPMTGYLLTKFKRRNFVQFGLGTMAVAMYGFAFAGEVRSYGGFLAIAFISRFLQGYASSSIQTTCFSLSALIYKEHQTAVIGYLETSCGIGLTIGPVLGSLLYEWLGYRGPFLFYGSVFLIFSLFLKKILPASTDYRVEDMIEEDEKPEDELEVRNKADEKDEDFVMDIDGGHEIPRVAINDNEGVPRSQSNSNKESPTNSRSAIDQDAAEVTFCGIFSRPKILLGCASGSLAYFSYSQMEPILALRLKQFDLSSTQMGLFFAILPIFYMSTGMLVQYQPKWVDNRVYLIGGCFLGCLAFLCNGPSSTLHFGNQLWLIAVGNVLTGICMSQLIILSFPEMLRQANLAFPNNEDKISNLCAGIFNSLLGVGQILGPLAGSGLVMSHGFRRAQEIVALINLIYGLIYIIFGGGIDAFKSLCPANRRQWIADNKSNYTISVKHISEHADSFELSEGHVLSQGKVYIVDQKSKAAAKGYQDYEVLSPIINNKPFMNTSGFLNNSNYT